MFYGKLRKYNFWLQTFTKNNIEPHHIYTASYEKSVEVLNEFQDTQNIKR